MPPVIAAAAAALAAIGIGAETALTIATIVVNLAISASLSLVSALFIGGPKKPALHASRENIRQPVAPRRKYVGRVKVGGVLGLLKLAQIEDRGDTVNGLFVTVAQAQGKFERQEEVWLGDGKVTLDGTKVVQPIAYNWSFIDWVILEAKQGGPTQTAMGLLKSGLPGQWTDDFKGLEVPYVGVRFKSPTIENFSNVYTTGLPAVSTVARTSPVWDPRDPNQSHAVPGHWLFHSNGILNLLHAVLDEDCLALPYEMVAGGLEVWGMEADYCDTWRALANGGSEPWFRLGGGWELTDPPKTWLPKLLEPMDARLVLRADGTIVPSVGRWREPELTISDNEIVSYSNFARGKAKAEIKNKIDATFISPDYDFIQQQADSLLNETSIDIDGEQSVTMDLDFAPSHAQARVRMKIEEGRQNPTNWNGTIRTKAYGLQFLTPNSDGSPKRYIHITLSELGVDDDFEVLRFGFDAMSGNCTFQVSQISSDSFFWNAADDEGVAPLFPRDNASNDVENPHNLAISVSSTTITATIDSPLTTLGTNFNIAMDYRLTADGVSDDEATWTALSLSGTTGTAAGLASGRYDVRARLKKTIKRGNAPDQITVQLYSDTRAIRGIKIGTGSPAPIASGPSSFGVVDCGGHTVQASITAPTTKSVISVKVWAAAGGSSTFAAASVVGTYDATSGVAVKQFIDVGAAGVWNFWTTATDIVSRNDSSAVGPVTVTVSGGSFADPAPVPSGPLNLVLTPNSSSIEIDWDANPGPDSVTHYEVWGGVGGAGYAYPNLLSSPVSPTYRWTGLVPETDYSVYIVAVNANGSSVQSDTVVATTLALSKYRQIDVASSPVQLNDNDTWVDINNMTSAALEVRVPLRPIVGQPLKITDEFLTISDAAKWTVKDPTGLTTIDVLTYPGGSHSSGYTGAMWRLGGGSA